MGRPTSARHPDRSGTALRRGLLTLGVLAALVASPARARVDVPLEWAGTLVIDKGGSNAETIRYTSVTVTAPLSGPAIEKTIQLSPLHDTLVIRGGAGYREECSSAAECWDGTTCVAATSASKGVCGWSGTELPAGCAAPAATLGEHLDGCAALWRTVQRDGAVADVAKTQACLAAGTEYATLTMSCPALGYRAAFEGMAFDLLTASQARLQATNFHFTVDEVRTHLRNIGHWYRAYRTLHPASQGAAANDLVWTETSKILGSFWRNLYEKAGTPSRAADVSTDLLDNLFARALDADRVVLEAALTKDSSGYPIRGAALAEVMGDALNGMSSRLALVGTYHDLACRFRARKMSCATDGKRTQISELVRLLAAAADPSALSDTLGRSTTASFGGVWGDWERVFTGLARTYVDGVFQEAVLDALPGVSAYSPDLLAPPPPTPGATAPLHSVASPPLMGLERIVQRARMMANGYQQTGLFDPRYHGVLQAGIGEAHAKDVVATVQSWTAALDNMVKDYQAKRVQYASADVQALANKGAQQKVLDQELEIAKRDQQLRADLAGLRNSIEVEQARFGDFMQAYSRLTRIVGSYPGTGIRHMSATTKVSGLDTTWNAAAAPPGTAAPLSAIVAQPRGTTSSGAALAWPILASAGDILTVNTSGAWSPSCALRTQSFVNPITGRAERYSVPNPALTGPEGYLLSLDGSTFVAQTNSSVHSVDSYVNSSRSEKWCAGAHVTPSFFGIGGGGSTEFCTVRDSGTRRSDVTSSEARSGRQDQMSAAFASGLRVPTTPFPRFPAGALLAIQVARGGRTVGEVVDVQVLQRPSTTVIPNQDVDVYLVVNDARDGACGALDSTPLDVSLDMLVPFEAISQALRKAMGDSIAALTAQQQVLLEQGSVGPQQLAAVRDEAYVNLALACDAQCATLGGFPAEILKYFDTWIAKELSILERKVGARTIERELELLALQRAALVHDYTNLGEQARLLQLIPALVLRDHGMRWVETKARSLVDLIGAQLYPVVDLTRPATLDLIDPAILEALLSLDWTGDLVGWSDAARVASTEITDKVAAAVLKPPPMNHRYVLLGVPVPGAAAIRSWPRVSDEQAQAIWDAIYAASATPPTAPSPFASISISPADLYKPYNWSTYALECQDAAPVVTAMALYVVRPFASGASDLEFPGLDATVSVDQNLLFPSVGELKSYRLEDFDWRNVPVRIAAGEAWEVEKTLDTLMASGSYLAGNGLSPFSRFDISLAQLATAPPGVESPMDYAEELILAFKVEARQVASVGLAPRCK